MVQEGASDASSETTYTVWVSRSEKGTASSNYCCELIRKWTGQRRENKGFCNLFAQITAVHTALERAVRQRQLGIQPKHLFRQFFIEASGAWVLFWTFTGNGDQLLGRILAGLDSFWFSWFWRAATPFHRINGRCTSAKCDDWLCISVMSRADNNSANDDENENIDTKFGWFIRVEIHFH